MEQITHRYINWILLSIVGFFCIAYFNKLSEIQKDLGVLQVQIAEINAKSVTRSEIRELIKDEIFRYHGGMQK